MGKSRSVDTDTLMKCGAMDWAEVLRLGGKDGDVAGQNTADQSFPQWPKPAETSAKKKMQNKGFTGQ